MPTRRSLRGVMGTFLATFTSRNRDHNGWWLFGLIENELDGMEVDLLSTTMRAQGPRPQFVADAIRLFHEQMQKQGLPMTFVRSAALRVGKAKARQEKHLGRIIRVGNDFQFVIQVLTDLGRRYSIARTVFVAPHDPAVDLQSTRRSRDSGSGTGRIWRFLSALFRAK